MWIVALVIAGILAALFGLYLVAGWFAGECKQQARLHHARANGAVLWRDIVEAREELAAGRPRTEQDDEDDAFERLMADKFGPRWMEQLEQGVSGPKP